MSAEPLAPEPFPSRDTRRIRRNGRSDRWDFMRCNQRVVPPAVGHQVLSLLVDTMNHLDEIIMSAGTDVPKAIARALGTLGEAAILSRYDAVNSLRVDMPLDDALSVLVLRGVARTDMQAQAFASTLSFLQRCATRDARDPMKVTAR